jgi:hypothetical protein
LHTAAADGVSKTGVALSMLLFRCTSDFEVFLFQGMFLKSKPLGYININWTNLTFVQNTIYKIYVYRTLISPARKVLRPLWH